MKQFLLSSGSVDTAVWLNYMDANEMDGQKAGLQIRKNAASNFKQVLEAAPNKAAAIRPPITKTIQIRRTRCAGHCCISRDELICEVFPWTPSHGRAKAGRPVRTYIQQLCLNKGCYPEDMPYAMNDREEWRKRVRDIDADGTTG